MKRRFTFFSRLAAGLLTVLLALPQSAWAEYDTISVSMPLYAEDGSVTANIPVVFSLNRGAHTCNVGFYRCDSMEQITPYSLTVYQAVESWDWGSKAGALVIPETITSGTRVTLTPANADEEVYY